MRWSPLSVQNRPGLDPPRDRQADDTADEGAENPRGRRFAESPLDTTTSPASTAANATFARD